MKRNSILLCLLFALCANFITPAAKAQVNTTDSLALVDLYHSTDGPNWNYHDNWLTTAPVSTWAGVTVVNNSVTEIVLDNNNLSGTLPSSIGNLVNLTFLDLDFNRLTGAIPAEIGKLSNVINLFLAYNQLSGAIPVEIGNLTKLTDIFLTSNQLTGTIPAEIGKLGKLERLELVLNQLTGTIPAEIYNLHNLRRLYLAYNQLSGTISAKIGNLKKLAQLFLTDNQLTGIIPADIGKLTNLIDLQLEENQLSGTIPAQIGNLTKLLYLQLNQNQLSGSIPASLGNLTNLHYLLLNNNQLSGTVPASFKNLIIYDSLNLSYNQLTKFGNANAFGSNSNLNGYVNHNLFTFNGLQSIAEKYHNIVYSPQDTILPIHKNGNILSVYAGGTLSNNTYKWFKVGSTNSTTITGDSTFHPSSNGRYYAAITNSIATMLTLYSDTINYTMPLAQTQNSIVNVAAAKAVISHFSIYPNPAKDIIHVQVNGSAIITLTNSAGKLLFSKNINTDSEINVSSYANGIYYIQNKTTGETQKVIVVH